MSKSPAGSSSCMGSRSSSIWLSYHRWPLSTRSRPSDVPEAVDRVQVRRAELLRRRLDAQALLRCETQHADLALVQVLVDVVRRLPGLLERVRLGQRRVDLALGDEAVGLPRLLVVGEVGRDDPLEVHPEVAVVVL